MSQFFDEDIIATAKRFWRIRFEDAGLITRQAAELDKGIDPDAIERRDIAGQLLDAATRAAQITRLAQVPVGESLQQGL